MAVKKSELYSSLWASCDALRGGMDASQYKDYILTLLFVKYVSVLAPGENRHFEPGENSQFQPGGNRQSVPGGCSQPRFGCGF